VTYAILARYSKQIEIHNQTCLQNTQVRCDRHNPCGNCQDAGISCYRRRDTKRRSKRIRRQGYRNNRNPSKPQTQMIPDYRFDAKVADISNNTSTEVMPECSIPSHYLDDFFKPGTRLSYDPAYDAQMTVQHQLQHLQGLTMDRRMVLESALSVIEILSHNSRELIEGNQRIEQGGVLSRIPSTEFLAWMLKGTPLLADQNVQSRES
jgi:hypothetical protein